MNTAQEVLTPAVPPPCSFPDSETTNSGKDSTNNDSNPNSEPKSAPHGSDGFTAKNYHVPPKRYAPKANFYQEELPSVDIDTNPSPERCQFMFSDGRQCTMGRSEIHPSLCRYQAEREEQLFGDPVSGGNVVGAALDLPELYSACRDLSTPAGVHRAVSQVFRLFAQRRISRQEASTFCHLGHLLLRTISLARSSRESLLAANVYQQDELRGVKRSDQELSRVNNVTPLSLLNEVRPNASGDPVRANTPNAVILSESGLADESKDLSASPPVNSSRESLLAANVYHPPQKGYQQDALFAGDKDDLRGPSKDHQELSPVNKVHHERRTSPDSAPQHKNGAARGKPGLSAVHPPPWVSASIVPAGNSQVAQNGHLRKGRQQLAPNQHLQNFET